MNRRAASSAPRASLVRALALPIIGGVTLLATLLWGAWLGGFPAWLLGMGATSLVILGLGFLWQERGNLRDSVLAAFYSLFVCLSCVFVYLIVANHSVRVDLTRHKLHTLSPQTVAMMRGLGQSVEVAAFGEPKDHAAFHALLRLYGRESDRLSYQVYDPVEQASVARGYAENVHPNDVFVTVMEDGRERSRQRIVLAPGDRRRESLLSNAILKATRGSELRLYMTTGKGEHPMVEDVNRRPNTPDTSFSTVAQIWGDRVLPITSFNMQAEGRIPDDAAVVILAGPQADLFDAERELLVDYLDEGGSLLVMLDPMMVASRGEMPNLMEILRRVGLGSPNDIIIDPFSGGRGLVFAAFLNNHPIMSGTGSLRLSLRAARPVALRPEEGQRGAMPKPLFLTNEKSWHRDVQRWIVDGQPLQPSDDDPVGSIVLAAASEYPTPGGVRGERARVVLVGDSDFLANDVVDNERAGLGLSMMNWLASRDDQLAIPPRLLPPSSFTLTQGSFWLLVGTLLLIGLGLLLGGTSYAVARRRMR